MENSATTFTLKIILLGTSGVGKTSLMNQFVNRKFTSQFKATIGADLMSKQLELDGNKVNLQIWDTAGQERFQSLGSSFYRGADACILVFDVTDSDSLDSLDKWHREFLNQSNLTEQQALDFPFIVIGNKVDRPESERKVSQSRAELWCERTIPTDGVYFECSAKEDKNVLDAFKAVARVAIENQLRNAPAQLQTKSTIILEPKTPRPTNKITNCTCPI